MGNSDSITISRRNKHQTLSKSILFESKMVFSRSQITVFLLFSLSLVAPFLGSPVYGNEYQQQAMYQQHYTVSDQTVPEHMRRYWGNNKPMAAATPTSSRDYVSEEVKLQLALDVVVHGNKHIAV